MTTSLVERLRIYSEYSDKPRLLSDAIDRIEALESALSAQQEAPQNHLVAADVPLPSAQHGLSWVSVEERLPGDQGQDSEDVLVFLNGHCASTDMECRNGGAWGIRIGFYDAEKGRFRAGGLTSDVTHWMPLPAAPTDSASPSAALQGEMLAATKDFSAPVSPISTPKTADQQT